jgi:predicted dehydrogenase
MPDVELVGLHDPSEAIVAHRAAELGRPPTFTDYRVMLEKTRPDFVLALGRHRVMPEIAHHLLDAGYPFVMEKPIGVSAADVRGVAEKATVKRGYVAIPLGQRYSPFTARARQMLADGRFGPLSHLYFRLNRPTSARYPAWNAPWMLDPVEAGGGCLRNLGTHCLDLFLHLTQEPARVIGAQVSTRGLGERVEDYASVLVRSERGVLGTIEVGNMHPRVGGDGEWKIAGRDALLKVVDDRRMRIVTHDSDETADLPEPEPLALTALRDALDRWRRGDAPPISVQEFVPVAELIDQAYALVSSAAPR